MNGEELLTLIPMYVAGTLSDEERRLIEERLPDSAELRQEIAFWQRVQQATISYTEYLSQGHPTSVEIVDYALSVTEGGRSALLDRHLNDCSNCREEFELIMSTYPDRPVPRRLPSPAPNRLKMPGLLVRLLKPVYAVPAIALAIILIFLFGPKPPEPVSRVLSVILPSQIITRGADQQAEQQVSLSADVSAVHFILVVPHTEIGSITYRMTMTSPDRDVRDFSGGLSVIRGIEFDSLKKTFAKGAFAQSGSYAIVVRELLSDSLKELTPEEYTFRFILSNR